MRKKGEGMGRGEKRGKYGEQGRKQCEVNKKEMKEKKEKEGMRKE